MEIKIGGVIHPFQLAEEAQRTSVKLPAASQGVSQSVLPAAWRICTKGFTAKTLNQESVSAKSQSDTPFWTYPTQLWR